MPIDYSGFQFSKPEPRKRTKARKARVETKVKREVRADVDRRDGHCRLKQTKVFGPCDGKSEWAHFEDSKRFKTTGKPPEERHTTAGSFKACRVHHRSYDGHIINVEALSPEKGCDGRLRWSSAGNVFEEPEEPRAHGSLE